MAVNDAEGAGAVTVIAAIRSRLAAGTRPCRCDVDGASSTLWPECPWHIGAEDIAGPDELPSLDAVTAVLRAAAELEADRLAVRGDEFRRRWTAAWLRRSGQALRTSAQKAIAASPDLTPAEVASAMMARPQ